MAAKSCTHLEGGNKRLMGAKYNKGLSDEFSSEPQQKVLPPSPQYSLEQNLIIVEEVKELLSKEAIVEVHNPQGGFYSNLFLVPQKDGGQRPVLNLKALNNFVQIEHFKMEGIHTLKDLASLEDWLAKVDLKDVYFAIPCIHLTTNTSCSNSKENAINSNASYLVCHWLLGCMLSTLP